MGVVYEAFDRERGERVALKTLQGARPEWLSRFKREFRSLHDLSHPNLVALGELFDGESDPFFSMELIEGKDLLSYVCPGTEPLGGCAADTVEVARAADIVLAPRLAGPQLSPCDETRVRAVLVQLLAGLSVLHRAGKVHCDIKPTNVMVDGGGRVVLLDFGLVAEASGDSAKKGGLIGTVEYMAPEQGMSGQTSPAADIYSLGVVLFEALTGRLPHVSSKPFDLLMKKSKEAAPAVDSLVSDAPADLVALCHEMLAVDPAERPSVWSLLDKLASTPREVTAEHDTGEFEPVELFVGRSAELQALESAYESVEDRAALVVVEGRSGVGKSRLVEHFLGGLAARQPTALVLRSRCYERELVPFKALDGIVEGAGDYLRELTREQREALMPEHPALLGRLFPVLRAVDVIKGAPPAPESGDPQEQRLVMFAALRELFAGLTARGPLVWFIDDLQWTDADSLTLLDELVGQTRSLAILIVATMRPARGEAREALVSRLAQILPTRRLELAELDAAEAQELVERLLPGGLSASAASATRSAGGHPLFLHELARHLQSDTTGDSRAANLEQMLALRIAQLPEDARGVLEVLAVAERPVAQEVAAIAAGLSISRVVKAATVLRAAHLARTDGVRRDDSIVPFHDRVRELVVDQLGDDARRGLHKRLAQALESTGAAEAAPLVLVRHAEAAGRHKQAAVYAERAARAATAALAFEQAADLTAKALELGAFDDAKRRKLRLEYASALINAGRGPEAAAALLEAAEGAEPGVRLDCQRLAAEQWLITGHVEEGLATMQSSMVEIGEPPAASEKRALARLLWNRARLRTRGLTPAVRDPDSIPPRLLQRLEVLRSLAIGLAMVDNIRGADFNSRYLLAALETGEPHHLASAVGQELVFLTSQLGRPSKRTERLRAELAAAVQRCTNDAYAAAWWHLASGAASFFEGQFRAALEVLQAAEPVLTESVAGIQYEKNNTRVFRVHTLRMMGGLRRQGELIEELLRAGAHRGDRYLVTTLRLLQVQSLLASGRVDDARQNIESATWEPPDNGFHLQHWYELIARAETALYEGAANEAVDELAPAFDALGKSMLLRVRLVRVEATALRGRLVLAAARARGGPAKELAAVHRIARRLEREKTGYASVYAALARAGTKLSGPEGKTAAVDELRQAIELAAAHGMALHEAAARDRLGRLLGGPEGSAERGLAHEYGEENRIPDVDRMFETAAPGLLLD